MLEQIPTREPAAVEWPHGALNTESLKAEGWRPTPFRQFILKICSRCNLACDYCYMYELTDQSWQRRPATMSRATVVAAARRIAEHAVRHSVGAVQVVLHGGEPLLAGRELVDFAVQRLRAALEPHVDLRLGMQTNGVLLDEPILELLLDNDIRVGVSLDGDKRSNDRHRRYRSGLGSYDNVMDGLRRLTGERYRHLFAGILAVIDAESDPVATYEHLTRLGAPQIDFLFPHATWDDPPPGKESDVDLTPYADWLVTLFDHWYSTGTPRTDIRLFRDLIRLILGQRSDSEVVGLEPMAFLVIETDGSVEQVDALKVAYAGAPETGLNVVAHDLDLAFEHPGVVARQIGASALSQTCRQCSIGAKCGAGLYAHRYRRGSGFLNPSVYCADLMKLINHVSVRVGIDLAKLRRP